LENPPYEEEGQNMKKILAKSLQDIFSKDVILFVFQIAVAAFALSGLFVWYFWGALSSFIVSYLAWIPWEWLQTSGAKVLTFGLAYMIFIVVIALLTSLYSEKLLIKLAKKHYPEVPVIGTADIGISILLTLKASMIFLVLFMLLLVFIFIPVIGQIVLLYLWSILLREPTFYDVSALFISDKKILKKKKKTTRLLAMIASLFNYIPVMNAFAPVFAQILFLHHILGKQE
jgi:MFS family permease